MIKMLQYKMYPAGELAVLRQLLFLEKFLIDFIYVLVLLEDALFFLRVWE